MYKYGINENVQNIKMLLYVIDMITNHLVYATVALDCSSSVDHGEDSYQVRGQCQSPAQCLPGSLNRARRDLETVFAQSRRPASSALL